MKHWLGILVRAFKKGQKDQMTDRAAAMTYNTLMAMFPAMLVGISILGLAGQGDLYRTIIDEVERAAPEDMVEPIRKTLDEVTSQRGTALTTTLIGIVIGLNGASGALSAAGRGLNIVLGVDDDRNFVRKKLHDIAWTLVLIVLIALAMALVFLGGGLAGFVADQIGLGETAETIWTIVRWPLALAVAMLVYAIVYYVAPDADERKFRALSPGAVGGVLIWLIASGLFFLYLRTFSNYSATYGAFAAVVALLIWIWLSNLALLLGAEINAVIDEEHHGVSHAPENADIANQRDLRGDGHTSGERDPGETGAGDGDGPGHDGAPERGGRPAEGRPAERTPVGVATSAGADGAADGNGAPGDGRKVGRGWGLAALAVLAIRGRKR